MLFRNLLTSIEIVVHIGETADEVFITCRSVCQFQN